MVTLGLVWYGEARQAYAGQGVEGIDTAGGAGFGEAPSGEVRRRWSGRGRRGTVGRIGAGTGWDWRGKAGEVRIGWAWFT